MRQGNSCLYVIMLAAYTSEDAKSQNPATLRQIGLRPLPRPLQPCDTVSQFVADITLRQALLYETAPAKRATLHPPPFVIFCTKQSTIYKRRNGDRWGDQAMPGSD